MLSSHNIGLPTAGLTSEHLSEEVLARSSGRSLEKAMCNGCQAAAGRRRPKKSQPNYDGAYALWCTCWTRNCMLVAFV